jgi:cation diffusion facilitator family transporter
VSAPSLTRFAWLSIGAALITMALKSAAYLVTGSVGLLSDAVESLVNLVAAVIALFALRAAEKPADLDHAFGHDKAEYFASGAEGAMILVAASGILYAAVPRLLDPHPIEGVGLGLGISTLASVVNLVVGRVLLAAGRTHRSITLEADGHHLMTDVWTSLGVIAGVALVALTGVRILDPIVAILVALHIVSTAWSLLKRSGTGLMDATLPREDLTRIEAILERFAAEGARWHALKTRAAGRRRFVSVHVLVPGDWTVHRGHDLTRDLEDAIQRELDQTTVSTHLEPLDDPRSSTLPEPPKQDEPTLGS